MKDYTCKMCGCFLFKGWVLRVDVQCPECGLTNILVPSPPHDVEEFYPVIDEAGEA